MVPSRAAHGGFLPTPNPLYWWPPLQVLSSPMAASSVRSVALSWVRAQLHLGLQLANSPLPWMAIFFPAARSHAAVLSLSFLSRLWTSVVPSLPWPPQLLPWTPIAAAPRCRTSSGSPAPSAPVWCLIKCPSGVPCHGQPY
ncbi:uncharacterized protein [Zea mays]|uniref:uncharacterized protein n=1 Tax=Zea mays TaxID=4577 RepID=UPI001651C725|nr:uncharacterized protein LOC118472220 [Zea mays]XP_035815928.1 uncharacterized protein LOC118472220 [Zea mays]